MTVGALTREYIPVEDNEYQKELSQQGALIIERLAQQGLIKWGINCQQLVASLSGRKITKSIAVGYLWPYVAIKQVLQDLGARSLRAVSYTNAMAALNRSLRELDSVITSKFPELNRLFLTSDMVERQHSQVVVSSVGREIFISCFLCVSVCTLFTVSCVWFDSMLPIDPTLRK